MQQKPTEDWDIRYPKAAATGISFARGRIDTTDTLLVHSAPPILTVSIHNQDGIRLAYGQDLEATDETPITRLTRQGATITRHEVWPTQDELGLLVILPGGEVGTLKAWWHADDHSEWRWQIELYNHR